MRHIDVSVMSVPCSGHKEGVAWINKGVDGYAPSSPTAASGASHSPRSFAPARNTARRTPWRSSGAASGWPGQRGFGQGELSVRMYSGHDDSKFLAAQK